MFELKHLNERLYTESLATILKRIKHFFVKVYIFMIRTSAFNISYPLLVVSTPQHSNYNTYKLEYTTIIKKTVVYFGTKAKECTIIKPYRYIV